MHVPAGTRDAMGVSLRRGGAQSAAGSAPFSRCAVVGAERACATWKILAAVATSWLAGYLVPGAPAGLGVREATLTAILGSALGTATVVSAALIWRFPMLFADALVLAAGMRLRQKHAASTTH